jgi:hypothetical protein
VNKETPVVSKIPNFQRMAGESDQAFRDRLDGRVAYVAGHAKLQADVYDVEKNFYPISIRWDTWVKPFEEKLQGIFYLDSDAKTIQALCQSGAEHPVVVYLGFDNGSVLIKYMKTHILNAEETAEVKENFKINSKGIRFTKIGLNIVDVEHPLRHYDDEQLWKKLHDVIKDSDMNEATEACRSYLSSPTLQHYRADVLERLVAIRQEETSQRLERPIYLLIIMLGTGVLGGVFILLGMWVAALFAQGKAEWTVMHWFPVGLGVFLGVYTVYLKFGKTSYIKDFIKEDVIKTLIKK